MKFKIILVLLMISQIFGCKISNNVRTIENSGGKITLKSSLNGESQSKVSGYIKEFNTNEVVQLALVSLISDNGNRIAGQTNQDGFFQITNLPSGKYTVEFKCNGFETMEMTIDIKEASNFDIEVLLKPYDIRVEKPVIYLYPTKTQKISVKINYQGTLTHTYPTYPKAGWEVTAEPNGTLYDTKGKEYYALFWEGNPTKPIIPEDGFVVKGTETLSFLEEKLSFLGLNRREANEFIMYWLPRMEHNAYNLIHFSSEAYSTQAELIIEPKPETMIRVMMLTQALPSKIEFPLQDIKPLKMNRKGYTLVEWGGSVIQITNSKLF